jgi:hypothetical protein
MKNGDEKTIHRITNHWRLEGRRDWHGIDGSVLKARHLFGHTPQLEDEISGKARTVGRSRP